MVEQWAPFVLIEQVQTICFWKAKLGAGENKMSFEKKKCWEWINEFSKPFGNTDNIETEQFAKSYRLPPLYKAVTLAICIWMGNYPLKYQVIDMLD